VHEKIVPLKDYVPTNSYTTAAQILNAKKGV